MRYRLRRQARPHLIVAGLWTAGVVGHGVAQLAGDAAGLLVVAPAAAAAGWLLLRHRRGPVPRRLLAGVAAAAAWLGWVIAAGPSWTATAVLVAGGYTASLRWWRRWRIPDPPDDPAPPAGPDPNHPPRLWKRHVAEGGPLAGSYLTGEQVIGTGLRYHAQLVPGRQTLGKALAVLPELRTGLLLRPGQDLILEQDPDTDESVISVTIVRASRMLSAAVPWPGPTYDPAAGTIRLGPYVDGEGTAEWLVHADNGLWGGFLAGSTGSGKSRMLDSIALGLAFAGCAIWYGDPQGGASSPFLTEHADHVASSNARIRDMLEQARKVKRLRQAENALNGWEGWTPDQGRPGLALIVDESHSPLADPECQNLAVELAREGRKVGIVLILASQVATLDAFGAGAGADALRSSVCSGNLIILRSKTYNTRNVLPGVDVDPTKFPRIAGYAYLIDDTGRRRTAPLRGYFLTDQARNEWGQRITWPALDAGGAAAAGAAYRNRHHQAEIDRAALAEWVAAAREGREPPADVATVLGAPATTGASAAPPAYRVIPFPSWLAWQQQQDRAAARSRPVTVEGGEPIQQPATTGRRIAVDVVHDLVAGGVTSPGELEQRSGYSETQVRNALRELAEAGRVRRVRHGVWEPAAAQ